MMPPDDSCTATVPKRIIACDVFRGALQHLGMGDKECRSIIYLPAHLHLRPEALRHELLQSIACHRSDLCHAGCLYGQCCPNIDTLLNASGIQRIACGHCYEILIGRHAYNQLMADQPGSFFLEKELIEGFDHLCRAPMELDDPQMRTWTFEHYRQVVYIRQPLDPDLLAEAGRIARFLSLRLRIMDADYGDLIAFLKQQRIL